MRHPSGPRNSCTSALAEAHLPAASPSHEFTLRTSSANLPPHSLPALQDKNVVSVKGGCLTGLDWSTAIHIWTKNAMVPIPEGSESHLEGSGYTDYSCTQEILDQPGELTGSGACNIPPSGADFSGTDFSGDCDMR